MSEAILTLTTGSLCGIAGGLLSTLSAWSLLDAWRWRGIGRRAGTVLGAAIGLVGGLAFVALSTMAWAAVFG